MARTGKTVESSMPLRRGTNVVVAVSGRSEAPIETKLNMLAAHVGAMLGGVPDWAGTLPNGVSVWVIGQGRPVFLRRLSDNARLDKWYRAMGEPVGPDREYWSVTIDWRGAPIDVTVPAGSFVVPAAARVVHGAESWPDGTIGEQRDRVAQTARDKALSDAASNLRRTYRHIADSTPSILPAIVAMMGGLGAWVWLRTRR